MIWIICMIISIAILVSAFLYGGNARIKHKQNLVLTPYQIIFAGAFLAVFVGMLPIFQSIVTDESGFDPRVFMYTASQSFQVFTVNAGAEFLIDSINTESPIRHLYSIYMACLFVVAPIITFGFLLSLLRNLMAGLRYLMHYFSDVYIFSELNDASLLLAQSLKKNHPRALIVFTDTDEDEADTENGQAASQLDALFFRKDITVVNFAAHSRNRRLVFITCGEESSNLTQALKLINTYRTRDNTDLYTFSTRVDSELLLASADKGKVHVRRINEFRSMIYHFLYEKGTCLFEGAMETGDGNRQITAVILGLGHYGLEMTKALAWYGQMDGYSIKLHIFDRDELAGERLLALCPELFLPEYDNMITVHAGVEIGTATFTSQLARLPELTFGFVALGDDEINIEASVNLRLLCERMGVHPQLRTIICNEDASDMLRSIRNYRGQNFDLESLGDQSRLYSEEILLGSELEKLALSRHLKWGREEEFWDYEYNYRSSMASAIHGQARIACHIQGAEKPVEALTEEDRRIIGPLEHRRWNAYMRSEGYIYSGSRDKSSRNDLGKMHHDLIPFEELTEEDKRKDV